MVGNNVLGHVKPELGHLCQHGSLFRNDIVQNYVETTDTVGCYHNQTVSIVINLAYFTFFDWL